MQQHRSHRAMNGITKLIPICMGACCCLLALSGLHLSPSRSVFTLPACEIILLNCKRCVGSLPALTDNSPLRRWWRYSHWAFLLAAMLPSCLHSPPLLLWPLSQLTASSSGASPTTG